MKSIVPSGINRRVLLSTLALLPALAPQIATAQKTKPGAGSAFSFAVYGDSRSMMYLPYKWDQEADPLDVRVADRRGNAALVEGELDGVGLGRRRRQPDRLLDPGRQRLGLRLGDDANHVVTLARRVGVSAPAATPSCV